MDDTITTVLRVFLYLIFISICSALASCHNPPKRNLGCLALGFVPVIVGALGSAATLLGHQFSSISQFWTWLGQSTDEAYDKHGNLTGHQWNGLVLLYLIAPVLVYVIMMSTRAYFSRKGSS